MFLFDSRDEILGIVIKAMENGGYGAFDTMVAVCEIGALLDNVNRRDWNDATKTNAGKRIITMT